MVSADPYTYACLYRNRWKLKPPRPQNAALEAPKKKEESHHQVAIL